MESHLSNIRKKILIDENTGTSAGIDTKNRLKVNLYSNDNIFLQEKTTITTEAKQIVFPENGSNFKVIHKTTGGLLYIKSESSVSSSNFYLEKNDILEINGTPNFELYGLANAGSIDVFVIATSKE
jgi:hypothetical protein